MRTPSATCAGITASCATNCHRQAIRAVSAVKVAIAAANHARLTACNRAQTARVSVRKATTRSKTERRLQGVINRDPVLVAHIIAVFPKLTWGRPLVCVCVKDRPISDLVPRKNRRDGNPWRMRRNQRDLYEVWPRIVAQKLFVDT